MTTKIYPDSIYQSADGDLVELWGNVPEQVIRDLREAANGFVRAHGYDDGVSFKGDASSFFFGAYTEEEGEFFGVLAEEEGGGKWAVKLIGRPSWHHFALRASIVRLSGPKGVAA